MKKSIKDFFLKQKSYTYKQGDIIIRVGDVISGLYYIESGHVKVYSLTESGEENLHFIYKPVEVFPLIWTFSDRNPEVYYEALTPLLVRRVSKEVFMEFMRTDQEALFLITKDLAEILHAFYERIHNLELTNSYPRIIARLIFLAKRLGREESGKIVFDFPVTQKDIANSINMTRETASKEMNKLVKQGIIECKERSVLVINDLQKLEKELLLHYERKSL